MVKKRRAHRLMLWLVAKSIKHPVSTVLLGLVSFVVSGFMTAQLQLRSDFNDLFSEKVPSVRLLRDILKGTGGSGFQAVLVTSPDRQANRRFLHALKLRLNRMFWTPQEGHRAFRKQDERDRQLQEDLKYLAQNPSAYLEDQLKQRKKHRRQEPLVAYALERFDLGFFRKRRLLFLSKEELQSLYDKLRCKVKHEFKRNQPGFVDLLGEKPDCADGSWLRKVRQPKGAFSGMRLERKEGKLISSVLLIRPRGSIANLEFTKAFVSGLKRAIAQLTPRRFHREMKHHFIGIFTYNMREQQGIAKDVRNASLLALMLLLTLILVYFRRLRVLIWFFVPLLWSSLVIHALAWLSIGYLNSLTAFIGVLLFGLGIDYGFYFIHRYLERRRSGEAVLEAIHSSYESTGQAVLAAAYTTAAAFFCLMLCRFLGFSQFGYLAGLGVLIQLFAMCTLLPALIVMIESWKACKPATPLWKARRRATPRSAPLIWAGAVVFTLGCLSIPRVHFDSNRESLGYRDDGLAKQKKLWAGFEQSFPRIGMLMPVIFSVDTEAKARRLQKLLLAKSKVLSAEGKDKGRPFVRDVWSLFRWIPTRQREKVKILRKIRSFLHRNDVDSFLDDETQRKNLRQLMGLLHAKPFSPKDVPLPLQREFQYRGSDGRFRYVVMLISGLDMLDGKSCQRLTQFLEQLPSKEEVPRHTGDAIVYSKMLDMIEADSLLMICSTFLVVSLIVFFDLGHFGSMALVLCPLFSGLAGLMLILLGGGIALNPFNIIVFPALLGICIDDGVHMVHRASQRERANPWDVQRELMGVMTMASLTTIISFASLVISGHMGVRSMGILAIIGLCTCLLSALFLLPAMMPSLRNNKR